MCLVTKYTWDLSQRTGNLEKKTLLSVSTSIYFYFLIKSGRLKIVEIWLCWIHISVLSVYPPSPKCDICQLCSKTAFQNSFLLWREKCNGTLSCWSPVYNYIVCLWACHPREWWVHASMPSIPWSVLNLTFERLAWI